MATITKSLTIESQGTYNLTFDLWSYSEWAASAGITTSYASLAALIADEKAVRQLMTVHASVDYFANCPDSTIISTVINNDLCAKWINLRDYALDTLSAKSNIKSVMDTADKYGYGEWVKTGSTWGPKGNVPIMTGDNTPYGVASAYQVFNGNANTSVSGTDFSYQSINPICVKRYKAIGAGGATITGTIQGSNNGSTWTNITLASNTTYYMYHRLHLASSTAVYTLQFYGRELTVKQASAPIDGREYIQIGSNYYTEDWGEKEFAQGSTRKTIYDHGVELVSIARSGHNSSNNYATQYPVFNNGYAEVGKGVNLTFYLFVVDDAIDTTNYTSLHYHGEPYNSFKASSSYPSSNPSDNIYMGYTTSKNPSGDDYFDAFVLIPYNTKDGEYDITNVNGNNYLGLQCTNVTRFATVEEFWLE